MLMECSPGLFEFARMRTTLGQGGAAVAALEAGEPPAPVY